jgi:hypothetical protein
MKRSVTTFYGAQPSLAKEQMVLPHHKRQAILKINMLEQFAQKYAHVSITLYIFY